MQEIIQMLTNNVGNKLTLELANGMASFIQVRLDKAVEVAQTNTETKSEDK